MFPPVSDSREEVALPQGVQPPEEGAQAPGVSRPLVHDVPRRQAIAAARLVEERGVGLRGAGDLLAGGVDDPTDVQLPDVDGLDP